MKKFIIDAVHIYLSMQYRLNRRRFLMAHIFLLVIGFVLSIFSILFSLFYLPSPLIPITSGNAVTDTALAALVPLPTRLSISLGLILSSYFSSLISWSVVLSAFSLILTIGRLYDLNKSYKYLCLYAVPGINLCFFLYLCIKKGSPADNHYGPPTASLSNNALYAGPCFYVEEPINTSYSASLFEQVFSWRGRLNRQRYFFRNIGFISLYLFSFLVLSILTVFLIGLGFAATAITAISDLSFSISSCFFILLIISIISFITILAVIIPAFWKIRRWHDLDRSGFYLLLTELPYYALLCGIPSFSVNNSIIGSNELEFIFIILTILWISAVNLYLLFIKGSPNDNTYGKDPIAQISPEINN
ncbi:DUF805 domain-containing protein [Pectinatus frisingensis]|uniref:DUF805 domain-containing protein n=1 Tax=Pectinatus frisingensis TaxID=865 RepID=UPI0015F37D8C|nr:DUF805 domain-containing protein [Pectinatus frisingensis]